MNDFLNEDLFNINCDLLVIPISTEGTISNSFRTGLEQLNIPTEAWLNKRYELGEIRLYPLQPENKQIVFACTVDQYKSAYYAIRLIGKRLAEKVIELGNIQEIATPILGTGAGKLTPSLSLNIMRSSFYENKKVDSIRLTYCTPDKKIYQSIINSTLDIDTPSAQLVLEAELPNILTNEFVEKVLYDKNFYFELAVKKFNEYLEYEDPYESFYSNLSQQFKSSGLTFKEYINSDLSKEEFDFTTLCGELIAYIDSNAYHKNIWNKYPDKRVLARSGVNQTNWFLNLIKYKQNNNNPNSVSPSIKNAFTYLKSPNNNFTMLSENHRKKAMENIFPNENYHKDFEQNILRLFSRLGIKPQNPKNLGAICSRILYLPFIKPIWNTAITKDSLFEEKIDFTDLSKVSLLIEECLKTKSKKLDIGNCGIHDLTVIPELFECKHLEELILSNEWAVYKDGGWQHQKSHNKGNPNNISFVPDSINELSELKILICGGDWNFSKNKKWNRWGISTMAPISKLKKLEYLNLSNNRLKSLSGLNKLTSLTFAHFNNNEISKIESLSDLKNLKELNLSNNEITRVDLLGTLQNIQTLDLHHNYIKDLSPIKNIIERIGISISKWSVNTLSIAKNPLGNPPMEVVNLGKEAVLGMLQDIKDRGSYKNKDIKIILVGNSEVGKSTLLKYLDNEKGLEDEHEPTIWMAEKEIKSKYSVKAIGEECSLHVFDFGGHDYFHDTHHLFYGTNTIYLLLWDQKTNYLKLRKTCQKNRHGEEVEVETQDYPLRYWLDSVKFHTKDAEVDNFEFEIERELTYNSSLLVIQNKTSDVSKIKFLDNTKLKEDYAFIYEIINISIIDPQRNLKHFDDLFGEMLNNMKIIGAILPKFYEQIKKSITSYNKPVLTFIEFHDYCNKTLKNPIDESQCRRLVKYLNQVGMLLYSDKGSEEKIYINKKWLIDNMHKILEKLTEKNGKFDRIYAANILETEEKIVDDVLTMMQEFKIIFKHPYSDTFIAPLYLPLIPDGKVNLFLNKKHFPFRRFEYNGFIHKSVILGIFQKFGTQYPLDKNNDIYYYWKNGLVIKEPVTDEIIMIKFYLGNEDGNACIDIYDLTNSHQTSEFRNKVMEYIRDVNQDYELEEMVTLDGLEYVSKELLEENAKIGKHIFSEKKLSEPIELKQQRKLFKLNDYMKFIDTPIKKKKVVISYSKKDLAQIHTLKRYLRPLVDAELIEEPWYCTLLNPGDNWDTKIKHKFMEADIVFFMVSEYFYSTKYIIEHEITTAINRYNNGENIKIVPIILEFYDWGRKEPYNLQLFSALPYQAKPISDFSNPKVAWHTITASVKMMIEKDLDPGKIEIISRDLEEIYERQVKGKLDNNF